MSKNWVVVANEAGARIFTLAPPAARLKDQESLDHSKERTPNFRLEEMETLEHPEGRSKAQDFDADRPGRAFQTTGSMRHGMEREVDAKRQAIIAFAQRVAGRLDSARRRSEMERLILVAPPEFLGLLRSALNAETKRLIEREVNLDLANMKPQEIRSHLPGRLFAGQAAS